jgi:hypothetical protein
VLIFVLGPTSMAPLITTEEVVPLYDNIIWVPRVGKKELVYHVANLRRELEKLEGLGDCTLR